MSGALSRLRWQPGWRRDALLGGIAERRTSRSSPVSGHPSWALDVRWQAGVWLVLGLFSAAVAGHPDLAVAQRDPALAAVIATLAGSVGLALMQLGRAHFLVLGRPMDLFAGLAFGILAFTDIVQLLGLLLRQGSFGFDANAPLVLVLPDVAAVLFVLGLFQTPAADTPAGRRRTWWRMVGVLAGGLGLAVAGAAALSIDPVPVLIDARAYALIVAGAPVQSLLRGQTLPLLVADGLGAGVMLVAALGYLRVARRLADAQVGWLAIALACLFFGQAHALLFPPIAIEYVSSGDLLRLAGYTVLLFSLVSRLGDEIAERASREERLRLSRELHDGLAQQLALLHIRLGESLAQPCGSEVHARGFEFAARQVEAALLEARQAIAALRSGELTWDEFSGALAGYVDEFAANHQVDVRMATAGSWPVLSATLQAEILRILHEAFSNALRHGGAQRIGVSVEAAAGWLELRVEDDGRGMAPGARATTATGGLGLASMAERVQRRGGTLQVAPGDERGVVVRARLPLANQG